MTHFFELFRILRWCVGFGSVCGIGDFTITAARTSSIGIAIIGASSLITLITVVAISSLATTFCGTCCPSNNKLIATTSTPQSYRKEALAAWDRAEDLKRSG
jgi:hypothetical protein